MKTTLYIFTALLFAFALSSCEKMLQQEPISNGLLQETVSDTAFKTAAEVEAALDGVYADFRNEYWELDYFVNGDAQSDDAYAGADNPANFQIDGYNIDAFNKNVSRDWGYLYGTIGRANRVINNVDKISGEEISDERRAEIKGEASFIRAMMYFQAVQLWGDVPKQVDDISTISAELLPVLYPKLYPARASADTIYSLIISDLEFALAHVGNTAANKGFATKGAVNTLLAKVYATRLPHDYAKVKSYCDAVITGGYSLMPDYEMLWDNQHENCAESIFEINYAGTSSSGNWGVWMFQGYDWKKFNIPSNDLVKQFTDENDAIRLNSSILYGDVSGKWSDANWPQAHYPFANKYRMYQQPSPQNYIIFRLADVLLLKAEALNESGDVSGAATLVNQVRHRVNLPNTPASTQDAMRLAIEKERRLELAFEGHRWFDLKRTGRAIEVITHAVGANGQAFGYQLTENRLVWPIPQNEMDKNGNLVQNAGY